MTDLPPRRPVPARAQSAFEAQVARLETRLQGVMGLCARHLESGEGFEVNGAEPFPMASTYKVPLVGSVLAQVDRGELTLDRLVPITERDVDETGPIAQSVRHPGVSLSLANLIELTLGQSNNNATDRVFALAGGPAKVTGWLRSAGFEAIRVDTLVNDLLNKFFGFEPGSPAHKTFLARYPTPEQQQAVEAAPKPAFDDDPADTTTPRAMADLLVELFAGPLLSETSRAFLIEVMQRCETGPGRLEGDAAPGNRRRPQDRHGRWHDQRCRHDHPTGQSRPLGHRGLYQEERPFLAPAQRSPDRRERPLGLRLFQPPRTTRSRRRHARTRRRSPETAPKRSDGAFHPGIGLLAEKGAVTMDLKHSAVAIIPCNDLDASEAFYARLGFRASAKYPHHGYRILHDAQGASVHLTGAEPGRVVSEHNAHGVYFYAENVEALAVEFGGAVEAKPWGLVEFAVSDPDGTLVRIGWPNQALNA